MKKVHLVLLAIMNFCTVLKATSNLMTQIFVGNYYQGFNGEDIPATSSLLLNPMGGWSDSNGNFYLADQTRIRKVDVFGNIKTICGTGVSGFTPDGAPATATFVSYVKSLWGDSLGNLFYIDRDNQRLRKIDAMTSVVTTVVGGGRYGFNGENVTGTNTTLFGSFMTGDSAGNLYFSDIGVSEDDSDIGVSEDEFYSSDNSASRVRKFVKSTGRVLTIAGNGMKDDSGERGVATSTSIDNPGSLVMDTLGNIFFIEQSSSQIRKVTTAGILETVVGFGRGSREDGPVSSADLSEPFSLTIDSLGNVFWVEINFSTRLRKFTVSTGLVSTLISKYGSDYAGDGLNITSNPSQIFINNAQGIWSNSRGDLFIADTYNYRVRSIVNQIINTVAGNGYLSYGGDGGPATSAYINTPGSVWGNTLGTVYFTDVNNCRIRAISASGIITTLGGTGESGPFTADGTAFTSMSLSSLGALSGDSNGNIYFFDHNRLRRYVISSSSVQTLAGDPKGYRLSIGGNASASRAYFANPTALWVSTKGDVYIADSDSHRVRLYSEAAGRVWDFAGNGSYRYAGDNVPATLTTLWNPFGVWGDTVGNVFISDYSNLRIRRVLLNGIITTFAGNGVYGSGSDGVSATSVALGYPLSVTGDSVGNIYFSDDSYCRVRIVTSSGSDYSNAIINTIVGTSGCSNIYTPGLQTATQAITSVYRLWVDSIGSIYMVEQMSNFIRKAFYVTALVDPATHNLRGNRSIDLVGEDLSHY